VRRAVERTSRLGIGLGLTWGWTGVVVEQGGENDGGSFYSCGGQPETLGRNAPDGLGVPLQGTAEGKAQKGERQRPRTN
jgi:hypothetical protein